MVLAATASSTAGIITASATLFIAFAAVITALTLLLPILRTTKSTHKLVNQRFTDMQNWNRALVRALNNAGLDVPIDQSIEGPDNAI